MQTLQAQQNAWHQGLRNEVRNLQIQMLSQGSDHVHYNGFVNHIHCSDQVPFDGHHQMIMDILIPLMTIITTMAAMIINIMVLILHRTDHIIKKKVINVVMIMMVVFLTLLILRMVTNKAAIIPNVMVTV